MDVNGFEVAHPRVETSAVKCQSIEDWMLRMFGRCDGRLNYPYFTGVSACFRIYDFFCIWICDHRADLSTLARETCVGIYDTCTTRVSTPLYWLFALHGIYRWVLHYYRSEEPLCLHLHLSICGPSCILCSRISS